MKFSYQETSLINPKAVAKTSRGLGAYLTELKEKRKQRSYDFSEAFLQLPFDDELLGGVNSLIRQKEGEDLGAVIVVGIGGSNLGTWAVYDALEDVVDITHPIFFAETVDPIKLQKILDLTSMVHDGGQHIELVVVSKSGSTTETIANFGVLAAHLKKIDKDWQDHIAVITNENPNKLSEFARENNFSILTIPHKIGDRYSVLSAVGLYPLGLAGMDLNKLRKGAQEAIETGLSEDLDENAALASAAVIFEHYQQVRTIHNTFFFAPQLATVGRWYRQLVGESLGKDHKGITPITSIGTTDLHSVGQLYLGGPDDKFTTLVGVKKFAVDQSIPSDLNLEALVEGLEGKTTAEIMRAVYEGVKKAYCQQELPFVEIQLDEISEETLGQFLQMKMMETIFLARLLEVNAFTQSAVESYKKETRHLLANQNHM